MASPERLGDKVRVELPPTGWIDHQWVTGRVVMPSKRTLSTVKPEENRLSVIKVEEHYWEDSAHPAKKVPNSALLGREFLIGSSALHRLPAEEKWSSRS